MFTGLLHIYFHFKSWKQRYRNTKLTGSFHVTNTWCDQGFNMDITHVTFILLALNISELIKNDFDCRDCHVIAMWFYLCSFLVCTSMPRLFLSQLVCRSSPGSISNTLNHSSHPLKGFICSNPLILFDFLDFYVLIILQCISSIFSMNNGTISFHI